jgi:ligand-binding sensor domain-containing protein
LLLKAQDKSFNFQHYGPEDGLSNNNVWAAKQGPDGLMYIATQNGVYSYDGYSFIKIKAKNLKTNYIRNVNFDTKELLIVNREDGIYSVNKSTNSASKNEALKFENKVDELIITGDFAYSLSDQIEISAINLKTKTVFKDELKKYDNQAYCIFKSNEGRVYIGRSTGLYWFNGEKQEKVKELGNNPVYSISTDNNGNLALGSANKIIIVNKNYRIERVLSKIQSS